MPDLVGLLLQHDTLRQSAPVSTKNTELDFLRMLGKNSKINALSVPGSAQRVGLSWPNNWVMSIQHIIRPSPTVDIRCCPEVSEKHESAVTCRLKRPILRNSIR